MKFFKCNSCNRTSALEDSEERIPSCCACKMDLVLPIGVEGKEKHIPKVEIDNRLLTIKVGEVLHVMNEDHYIQKIIIETNKKVYVIKLFPNIEPIVKYILKDDEELKNVYSYCNVHGLYQSN